MNVDLPDSIIRKARIVDLNRFYKLNVKSVQTVDIEAINWQILNIIQTEKGTYPFEPTFGVNLEKYIFRLGTDSVLFEIESEIISALNQWMNHGNVKPRNVKAIKSGINQITVSVAIDLKNSTQTFNYRLAA